VRPPVHVKPDDHPRGQHGNDRIKARPPRRTRPLAGCLDCKAYNGLMARHLAHLRGP
jgi:hypothetical protein